MWTARRARPLVPIAWREGSTKNEYCKAVAQSIESKWVVNWLVVLLVCAGAVLSLRGKWLSAENKVMVRDATRHPDTATRIILRIRDKNITVE